MLVKNKSKRCIRVNKVVLKPGSNLLRKDQVENFNKSIDFAERLIENGVLEVPDLTKVEPELIAVEEKEIDDDITSIAEMTVKDAISVVKDTVDKSELELFMEQETDRDEPRITIVRAIEKQIGTIEEAQGGKGDGEEGGEEGEDS